MKTKTEPIEVKERKTVERNPLRQLLSERGRKEFAVIEIEKKIALEHSRHKTRIAELGEEKAAHAKRHADIEEQLKHLTNGKSVAPATE